MQFILQENLDALRELERHRSTHTIYDKSLCLKALNAGTQKKTIEESLSKLTKLDISESDVNYILEFFNTHSKPLCCLPKGHSGPCQHDATSSKNSLVPKLFFSKLKDCHTSAGNTGFFKNRISRSNPVQVLRKFRFADTKDVTKVAIPLEFSGTGYTAACSQWDWISLLMHQQGIQLSEFMIANADLLLNHAAFLTQFYKQTFNINLVNEDGYLCDPYDNSAFTIDQWSEGHQIQFAHILPVSDRAYMTRGMNTIPMTRRTNIAQQDMSWTEFIAWIKKDIHRH